MAAHARNWKIGGATTVALGTLGGIVLANSNDIELNDRVDAIELAGAAVSSRGRRRGTNCDLSAAISPR